MANTYKWVISGLHAKINDTELGLQNVVESVHYRFQAEDAEGNIADTYGSVAVEDAQVDGFIPYESLTQADVEAWLEAKLDVESLKAGLDAQLESKANPTHATLPLNEVA